MKRPDPDLEDWLVPFLGAIRGHPEALLGSQDVMNLHFYLIGYNQGRRSAGARGISVKDAALLDGFAVWLRERLCRGQDLGWPMLVRLVDHSDRNLDSFFELFTEFLESRNIPWPATAAVG